jgi:hypothetical protein
MHDAEGINFSVGFITKPDTGKDIRRLPNSRSNYEKNLLELLKK